MVSWNSGRHNSRVNLTVRSNAECLKEPIWLLELESGKGTINLGSLVSGDVNSVHSFVAKHFRRVPSGDEGNECAQPKNDLKHHKSNHLRRIKANGEFESLLNSATDFENSLIDCETGAMSLPAFIYLLKNEFNRHMHDGAPFSLIMLAIRSRNNNAGACPLDIRALLVERINRIKRSCDQVGSFGHNELALLLPNTDRHVAELFARRMENALRYPALTGDNNIYVTCGFASVPEDEDSLESLLHRSRNNSYWPSQLSPGAC